MAGGGRCSRCTSSRVTVPPSPRSRPPITLSNVVLPDPLGPISPTISPRPTENDTPAIDQLGEPPGCPAHDRERRHSIGKQPGVLKFTQHFRQADSQYRAHDGAHRMS